MPTLFQINTSLNFSSTGKIAEQIGVLARKEGWGSYIAHGARYVRPTSNKSIRIGSLFGELSHVALSILFDGHGLGSILATKKLITTLKRIKPDIIHLHNIHGYYLNYRLLFKYLSSIDTPIIWTLHDCWPFTGHCVYFDAISCDKWKSGCGNCPQIGSYPRSYIIDRTICNFRLKKSCFTSVKNLTLVPVSNWLGKLLDESYLRKYPIRVLHNGIDLNVFKPQESAYRKEKLFGDKFVILGVASGWNEGRRLNDFKKLASLLSKDFLIILIGLSPKQIATLPANMIGLERTTDQQELAQYYSMADVFVYPTYEDNFPTVNLEALACGTPVVTYNTGGCPEAIDEQTGIIVEKGNIEELSNAIKHVKQLGKEFYTQACRTRAEKLFDKNSCFKGYFNLYDQILG